VAEFPVLPLFTDAYLSDTLHLTTAQHGAYVLLLMAAWRSKDCSLPDDDAFLSKITRMDRRTWLANKATVMAFWTLGEDAKFRQGRLSDERKNVEAKRASKTAAGKASALKRHERSSTELPTEAQRNSTIPSPSPSREEVIRPKPPAAASDLFQDQHIEKPRKRRGYPDEFSTLWSAYPTDPGMSKLEAFKAWDRLDQADKARLLASVPGWKAWTAKQGKDYRMLHLCRYISQRRFETVQEVAVGDWPKRLAWARENRQWPRKWGAMPGQPGCEVPAHLLAADDGLGWSEWSSAA
jgi:uncharacterized protein YdaU (DUF1376 family)